MSQPSAVVILAQKGNNSSVAQATHSLLAKDGKQQQPYEILEYKQSTSKSCLLIPQKAAAGQDDSSTEPPEGSSAYSQSSVLQGHVVLTSEHSRFWMDQGLISQDTCVEWHALANTEQMQ